jgi:hypothetical protein
MAVFLTISEGETGGDTQPVLARSDPKIIAAVLRELESRLRGEKKVLVATLRSAGKAPTTSVDEP